MENLELYISFILTSITLLSTTITFLMKFIKNKKLNKILFGLKKVSDAIIPYIEEAETFIHYTGEEKKAYVITRTKELMIKNKITIDDKLINDTIEELVSLSKKVNNKQINHKELKKLNEGGI